MARHGMAWRFKAYRRAHGQFFANGAAGAASDGPVKPCHDDCGMVRPLNLAPMRLTPQTVDPSAVASMTLCPISDSKFIEPGIFPGFRFLSTMGQYGPEQTSAQGGRTAAASMDRSKWSQLSNTT